MTIQHKHSPFLRMADLALKVSAGDLTEGFCEGHPDILFAAPGNPGGSNPSGTDGGDEIRDESGLGSGAGVSAEDAAAGSAEGKGVDITEGGTDAGGTDFGANMGGPGDTGGIDVKSLQAEEARKSQPDQSGLDEDAEASKSPS